MQKGSVAFALIVAGAVILIAVLLPNGYSCGQGNLMLVRTNVGPACVPTNPHSIGLPTSPDVYHRLALRFLIALVGAAIVIITLMLASRPRRDVLFA